MDIDTLLASAKLPERTVAVCLRGDLQVDFEALERDLEEQRRAAPAASLAGTAAEDTARRIEALREQMLDATHPFRFRALSRPAWRQLLAEHPARPDDADDRQLGFNRDTYFDALIKACLIDPDLTAEQWARLDEVLTDKQYGDLIEAAWSLNRRDVDVPFSHAASRILRNSETE